MIYRIKPTAIGFIVCRYEETGNSPVEYRTGIKWSGHRKEAKIYLRAEDATNGIVQGRFKG